MRIKKYILRNLLSNTLNITIGLMLLALAMNIDVTAQSNKHYKNLMRPSLAGTVNVGTGEAITSLTNPGGAFEMLNNSTVTGDITINITSDLLGETGSIALNEFTAGFGLLIKTTGVTGTQRKIQSTTTAPYVIKLNDADHVTIDGEGALQIINTNSSNTAEAVIWLASQTNGAQFNTIKNLHIQGGAPQNSSIVYTRGIVASSASSTFLGGADNNNNTYQGNTFWKLNVGIESNGLNASTPNQNTLITKNRLGPGGIGDLEMGTAGVILNNENNATVSFNNISGIGEPSPSAAGAGRDRAGIVLGAPIAIWSNGSSPTPSRVTNSIINGNSISNLIDKAGSSLIGILLNADNAGNSTNNLISNNAVINLFANSNSSNHVSGIGISYGNGDKILNNSIFLRGNPDQDALTPTTGSAFGINILNPNAQNITILNNYAGTDLTTPGALNAALNVPSSYFWGTGSSNFNNWHVPTNARSRAAAAGGTSGTFYPVLSNWQNATGKDVNSLSVDPHSEGGFTMHLLPGSPMIAAGTPLADVPGDEDGDPRQAAPDIGADEFINEENGVMPTGTFFNGKISGLLTGDITFIAVLYMDNLGVYDLGPYTLGFGCKAQYFSSTVGDYFVGNVKRDFCDFTDDFIYPVGTLPNGAARHQGRVEAFGPAELSRVSISAVTGSFPSTVTVNVQDTWLPGLGETSSVSRYWNVTRSGGAMIANLSFFYLGEDIYGNEPAYRPFKKEGGAIIPVPGTVFPASNFISVTNFDLPAATTSWSAGVVIPTAARADIGGRVLTADGHPIANVRIQLVGGDLTQARTAYTSHMGYYLFTDLPVGENYVITVKSRRFYFAEPSKIISLQDSLLSEDFIAEPQE